jgi:hypothetical protein
VRVVQPSPQTLVDVDELIGVIVRRWSVTASRGWTATIDVGVIPADPERLEATLDCLLENAINSPRSGMTLPSKPNSRTRH